MDLMTMTRQSITLEYRAVGACAACGAPDVPTFVPAGAPASCDAWCASCVYAFAYANGVRDAFAMVVGQSIAPDDDAPASVVASHDDAPGYVRAAYL